MNNIIETSYYKMYFSSESKMSVSPMRTDGRGDESEESKREALTFLSR
jgi:hypothetical protein